MIKLSNIKYQADTGKVFKNKLSDFIGSELIIIGCNDSIDNYEEVDKPIEPTTPI